MTFDLGTSSVKCMVMDDSLKIQSVQSIPYQTYTPQSGYVEQDPHDWIKAAIRSVQAVKEEISVNDIEIISLSGHMSGLVLIGNDGEPLYPCITLADSRGAQQVTSLSTRIKQNILACTGNPYMSIFLAPKLIWMRENFPSIYRSISSILFPKDFIRFWLTGCLSTDPTDAGNSLFFDDSQNVWIENILSDLKIERSILPDVKCSYEVDGYLTKQAADQLGLKAGIPVAVGAADMAAAALGTGVNHSGQVAVTIGTSATIIAPVNQKHRIGSEKITYHPSVFPNASYALGSHFSGGLSLNWFAKLISQKKTTDYHLLQSTSKEASQLTSNSRLLFLPFLVGSGSPHFNEEAKGSLIGLTSQCNRAMIFKAIVEGICFNLKETVVLLEKMNLPIETIRAGGGGMKVSIMPSALANILNRPIQLIKCRDASAVGASLIGAYSVGMITDLRQASNQIVGIEETLYPNHKLAEMYKKLFTVYQEAYSNLLNCWHQLSSI